MENIYNRYRKHYTIEIPLIYHIKEIIANSQPIQLIF